MHIEALLDPYTLHSSILSKHAYYKLLDHSLFPNDYITEYMQAGYNISNDKITSVYDLIIKLFYKNIDFYLLLKIVTLILVLITVITVAITAWKIGGAYVSWSAATLCYTSCSIIYQITSAVPHMFAYPIIGIFCLSMIYGRVYYMALINILGSFLYLPVGMMSGAALAGYLLLMPSQSRGEASEWSFVKRFALLSICGIICLANLYPVLTNQIEGYGEYLKPFEDIDTYPETAEEEMFAYATSSPVFYSLLQFTSSFKGAGILIFAMTAFICLFGMRKKIFFRWLDEPRQKIYRDKIIAYFLSVMLFATIIYIVDNFHSYRFFIYSVPLLYCTILPLMVLIFTKQYLISTKLDLKHFSNIALVLFTFAFAFLMDTSNKGQYGYSVIPESDKVIYNFAETTPKNTIFAGMPGYDRYSVNIIDYLPVVSKRTVLISTRTHQSLHKDYLLEMRKRMNLVIDSHYSSSNEAIKLLHEQYKVDYLIINIKDYEEKPIYFQPFENKIAKDFEQAKQNKPYILNNLDRAIIKTGSIHLFDLAKLLSES